MADFSSNLKRIRKRENLSQDLLAEKLRVTRQTISNWERGNSYPDLDMLVQISEILNTNPNELLYPPVKNEKSYMDRLIKKTIWGKLAIVVFVVGFLFGLSSGSQAYSPAPNIVGWHFVFSDAISCWFPAFLIGMTFLGIEKIVALLYEIKGSE